MVQSRIRNLTAVLGPTNTGKTHLAIERMLGHQTGMIGLPLRLLAREVYDKVVARAGRENVALITGEEKIKPEGARYWVSTVEAMPRDVETDFLAIDEIQLAADPERGHVFTDRLIHARGRNETLVLGAATMREAIDDLIPGANFISRPRLSKIAYSGQKKITRLPKRAAIVAFSAAEVYSIAELIRRQIGGAAVVLGALSPRTRNAQVALYQSGDVDYIVATDAIGMGLNLDVDHVAFAGVRKFDGHVHRNLSPAELAQVAGRAGRHMNDGTFGVTADVEPFEADLIERLENHTFDTIRVLQWRNRNLDLRSLDALRDSLRETPGHARLQRARMADDLAALETLASDRQISDIASGRDAVAKLWEVCQVPDYRKISSQNHAEMVATLYGYLMSEEGRIPEDWFAKQVEIADRTDGDIDTLANRLSHIRTWTFVSNRPDWLRDPVHWQERTRAIEDNLSDALHEQLTQRFVDRKTSALMKGLRDKEEMTADIAADGAITVENHYVGRLKGFRFIPDTQSDAQSVHAKASRTAAAHVLSKELAMRARRVASARPDAFKITRTGRLVWRDEEIATLEASDDPLKPVAQLLCDEHISGPDKEKVQARLDTWITEVAGERLKPLMDLKAAEDIAGLAKGIAFRLVESFGSLKREAIADEVKQLDQNARAQLRKYGVRFGAFNIFMPLLLKPAPAELTLALWTLKHGVASGVSMETPPDPPRAGLTSAPTSDKLPEAFYRAVGYHVCGPRAIRMDILERLADLIRPLLAWRPSDERSIPPKGSSGDGGFIVTPEMMSILGCSSSELGNVLQALGFRSEKRPAPPKPAAVEKTAGTAPVPERAPAEASVDGDLPEAAEAAPPETTAADAGTSAPAGSEPAAADTAQAGTVVDAEVSAAPVVEAAAPDEAGPAVAAAAENVEAQATTAEPAAEAATATEAATAEEPATEAPEPAAGPAAAVPEGSDAPVAVEPATDKAQAAAEPVMVDVWRPRRRERPERRPYQGRNDSRGDRNQSRDRNQGNRSGRDRDRQPWRRNDQQQAAAAATGPQEGGQTTGTATPGSSASEPSQPARDDRRDNRDNRDNRDRRDNREGRDSRDRNQGQGRGRDDRDRGRRDDRRRDDDRSRQQTRSAGPQRSKGPDPNSPFAALSALKSQLEKAAKERGSA